MAGDIYNQSNTFLIYNPFVLHIVLVPMNIVTEF